MEAYFHSDPRIEQWVNQITENIFTVCLLTGADSEVEFQKGREIVEKLTQVLQGISIFPPEYLEDGLKQLLEQQLPDSRVINNFPSFQATMNKMLHEGMTKAMNHQNNENPEILPSIKQNTQKSPEEDARENDMAHYDETMGRSVDELENEFERVMTAMASVNSTTENFWEPGVELQIPELEELMATSKVRSLDIEAPIPSKPYGIIRKTQIPDQANRLKHVLENIFPNVTISWNLNLMGHTFLAQVEDILICLQNPKQPCPVEKLNKEGWKVYTCSAEDLLFPRRLDRGIRQIQRLGKLCKKG